MAIKPPTNADDNLFINTLLNIQIRYHDLLVSCYDICHTNKKGDSMKRIENKEKLNHYMTKYKIGSLFSTDLSQEMNLFHFDQNEIIYADGDEVDYFYFFVDGKAKVYSTLSNGKSLLLSFYEPLRVLGDIESINQSPVTVNVKTISEVYCIGLKMSVLQQHLKTDATFLHFLCSNLSDKLNRCSKNASINQLYPLENRLASYIIGIDTKAFKTNETLTFYDSLTEISELLGTSYRHLLRTIRSFTEDGILEKTHSGYKVIDRSALKALEIELYS